jgi:fatty-acyl-CoA synthase
MQDWPLSVMHCLKYAEKWHAQQQIICKTVEGPISITTYADLGIRAKLCAIALLQLGIK